MFGRRRIHKQTRVIHTPECTAIHEAMLMSLYLGYGAPSAPLFIPSGGLVCTCDQRGDDSPDEPSTRIDRNGSDLRRALVSV